jgi:5'-3' exonuclease
MLQHRRSPTLTGMKTEQRLDDTMKLLAIDGLNIVRRVYEANPEPDTDQKADTAVRNALASFQKILAVHQPTHVLPAFDYGGSTWRHALHPSYKEARQPMPTALQDRIPQLCERLAEAGMNVVSVPDVEADDVIATAVLRWLAEGKGEAVVVSTDKGLHILIQYGAILWDHFKGEQHDRRWVEEKFGVPPEALTDFLALVGDRTNGIPGVAKVGGKTAAALLQRYKSLEGVMAGAGILKDALGERLRKDHDNALLSQRLVTLKTDVRLSVTWNMLAYARQ